jgi:formylglycine-generating enzyme
MRKLLIIVLVITVFFSSCGYYGSGDLTGVTRNTWYTPDPYGMLFVPPGTYQMGPSDEDVPNAMTAQSKTVTVQGFWMDETEITNAEYRQFIYWVRDSLALTVLASDNADYQNYEETQFFMDYSDAGDETIDFFDEALSGYETDVDGFKYLNWNAPLDYSELELRNNMMIIDIPRHQSVSGYKLQSRLYIAPPKEAFHYFRRVDLNTDALYYEYWWVDLKQAAKKHTFRETSRNKVEQDVVRTFDREQDHGLRIGHHFNPETGEYNGNIKDREKLKKNREWEDFETRDVNGRYDYFMHEKVHIYPDTLCWMSDYTYSYNEPMTKMYFWHPAYDHYPVVGVNWKQANAFSVWRSNLKNSYQRDTRDYYLNEYRLPTESEWEYASRGGLDLSMYPWGGYYTRNFIGCFIANFKPMRGNYYDDGGVQTLMVATYDPNEWGLYDMAGNVAEWTRNAFDESAYSFTHDLNPDYQYYAHPDDPPALKRKVIRGGSWKDVAVYMQNSVRTFEYQDTAKSYIGFRNVRTYLGRHREDGTSYSQVY